MNREAAIIEKVESYIRGTMQIVNRFNSEKFGTDARVTHIYPYYLKDVLKQLSDEQKWKEMPYVKKKLEDVSKLLFKIKKRCDEWKRGDPMENVFSEDHLKNAIYYIPRWPLYVHLMAAIIQMGASGAFHQFQCMSADHMDSLFKLDLIGIGVMISGSAVAPLYYTYMCNDSFTIGMCWLGMIFLLCTTAALITVFKS